jgi:hypothetical protein
MSAKQSDREYQKSKKDRQYDRRDKPVSQPTLTVVFHLVTFQEDASFVPAFCLGLIAASFALSLVNRPQSLRRDDLFQKLSLKKRDDSLSRRNGSWF